MNWKRKSASIVLAGLLALTAGASPGRSESDAADPIFDGGDLDQMPKVLTQVHPEYPPALRALERQGKVIVEFLVYPDGTVRSAHALAQPPEDPLFVAAAIAAVSQWTFQPGRIQGAPVITRMQVPMIFELSGGHKPALNFKVGPLMRTSNVRTGVQGVIIRVRPGQSPDFDVVAGRFLLDHAEDDTGLALKQEGTPGFHYSSVGRIAGDQALTTSRQPISFTLWGVASGAQSIKALQGKLEIFVPGRDPDAMLTVADLASWLGRPLEDPVLKKAGVSLTIFDQPTANRMYADKTPGGPQDYDSGPIFGSDYVPPNISPVVAAAMKRANKAAYDHYPPALAARMKQGNEMAETEIGVGRSDPRHKIVALEFQSADGHPLEYNHNGRYHADQTDERGFDVYDVRSALPQGARLVCWILTDKSVISVPVQLADLPIPLPAGARPNAPASPPAAPAP